MSPATLQLTTDLEVLLPGMRVMGQIDNLDLVLAADDFSEGGNRLGIIDRDTGSVTEVGRVGGRMRPIEFSPDGGRILYGEFGDVWIHHLETGVDQALLFSAAPEHDPNFSPDGNDVLFTRGPRDLSVVPANGSRPPEPIELPEGQAAGIDSSVWFGLDMDWGGDRIVVAARTREKGDYDLLQFPLGRPEEASTVKATDASEGHPALSSDGRFLAYTSEESGRNEVYVTTFPDGAGSWRISEGGGEMPRWRGDGGELFFVWENRIHAVTTDPSSGFRFGRPSVVFEADARIALRDFTGRTYDVSPDGARFVARVQPADSERQTRTLLVTNWRSLIEAGGVEH